MVVPILIFVVCFGAGFAAAVRWLPPLADAPVGTLAGFVVAGLIGAAIASVGLHMYLMARRLDDFSGPDAGFTGTVKGEVIADAVLNALYYGGLLAGVAFIVYLLAPRLYGDGRQHQG